MTTGTVDLVVRTPTDLAVIDHKAFPGTGELAIERAQAYSGQLAAYKNGIATATGEKVSSTWIHFPVLGQLIEVCF